MKLLEISVLNLEKYLSEQFWIHDSNLYLPLYLFFVFLLKDVKFLFLPGKSSFPWLKNYFPELKVLNVLPCISRSFLLLSLSQ